MSVAELIALLGLSLARRWLGGSPRLSHTYVPSCYDHGIEALYAVSLERITRWDHAAYLDAVLNDTTLPSIDVYEPLVATLLNMVYSGVEGARTQHIVRSGRILDVLPQNLVRYELLSTRLPLLS